MKFYLRSDVKFYAAGSVFYTNEMAQFAKLHQDESFNFEKCSLCSTDDDELFVSIISAFPSSNNWHWYRDWLMDEEEKEVEKTGQLLLNFG